MTDHHDEIDLATRKVRSLTMERGPCYGACPIYRVTVDSDGRVEWFGEEFVAACGSRCWNVPPSAVSMLEDLLARMSFIDLENSYLDYAVTDCSSARLAVVFKDGTMKTVDHYHGDASAPRSLSNLECRIDRILGTKPYIKDEETLDRPTDGRQEA